MSLKRVPNQQRAVVEKLSMQLAEYRESEGAVSLDSQENIAREQLAALNAKKLARNTNGSDQISNLSDLVEAIHCGKSSFMGVRLHCRPTTCSQPTAKDQ